jgi:hypothetical protein
MVSSDPTDHQQALVTAKVANWTRFTRDIIEIAPFGPSIVRKYLLEDLETNSKTLKAISDAFQHRAMDIKITSFYERENTLPMKRLVGDPDQIYNQAAAA